MFGKTGWVMCNISFEVISPDMQESELSLVSFEETFGENINLSPSDSDFSCRLLIRICNSKKH